MPHTPQTKGALALIGAAVTYASFGLLIRQMAQMFGPNTQVAFRFVLAFIFLGGFVLLTKRFKQLPKPIVAKAIIMGLLFSLLVLLFTISATHTKLANTVFLLYAGSIVSSLLVGTLVLKEKLSTTKIIAILLALAGLVMYADALLTLSLGVVTGLLSGVLDGIGNGIRKTLKGFDRSTVMLYQFAAGGLFSLLLVALSGEQPVTTVSLWPVVAGVVFAILQISLNHLLLYGFQHFDVNVGTVILATELFFASLIGWIFYAEIPATNELIGGLIIFAASIISAVDFKRLVNRT